MYKAIINNQHIEAATLNDLKRKASIICNKNSNLYDDMIIIHYIPNGDVHFYRKNERKNGKIVRGKWLPCWDS